MDVVNYFMEKDWPEVTVKEQTCLISNSHDECNTLLRSGEDFIPALDIPIDLTVSKLSDYSRKRPATFKIEFSMDGIEI
jgi:hypothetical protein